MVAHSMYGAQQLLRDRAIFEHAWMHAHTHVLQADCVKPYSPFSPAVHVSSWGSDLHQHSAVAHGFCDEQVGYPKHDHWCLSEPFKGSACMSKPPISSACIPLPAELNCQTWSTDKHDKLENCNMSVIVQKQAIVSIKLLVQACDECNTACLAVLNYK